MSTICFVKYQGAGNDFILIDDRALFFDPTLVATLCHRKFGIGADGVILLQQDLIADFRMRIYNADGSEAESCGNGLRCLLRFICRLGYAKKPYTIRTGERIIQAHFVDNQIALQMGVCENVKKITLDGHTIYSLNTGVPHAVLFVDNCQVVDLEQLGRKFRFHSYFAPAGTNVNVVSLLASGKVAVRTYERGVEGETLSCGTGAVAVASIASHELGLPNPIRLQFLGGCLEVVVEPHSLTLIGDAEEIFFGSVSIGLDMKLVSWVQ